MADIFRALLLYVPEPDLITIAREHRVAIGGRRKREIAQEVVQHVGEAELWQLIRNFARAGRSVVSWYLPERRVAELTRDSIQQKLADHYEGNPFEGDLKFGLTAIPEVVSGLWLSGDTALLELVRLKEVDEWEGLQLVARGITVFSRAILRTGSAFLECWGDYHTAKATGKRLGLMLGLGATQQVVLTDDELDALTGHLNARVAVARVKDDSGNYDTIEVVADPVVGDLLQTPAYKNDIAGKPSVRRVVEFDPPGGGSPVRLEVTRSSSFWFRGFVEEEVVEHVLSIVRRIKGF